MDFWHAMAHADCLPPGRPSRSRNVGRAGGQPSAARRRRVQLGAAGLGREEWHAPGGVGETPRARCPWVVAAAASRRETRRARMRHALRTVMRLSDALKTCRAACVAASRQRVGWGRSISDGEELGTLQGGKRAWMGSLTSAGRLLIDVWRHHHRRIRVCAIGATLVPLEPSRQPRCTCRSPESSNQLFLRSPCSVTAVWRRHRAGLPMSSRGEKSCVCT